MSQSQLSMALLVVADKLATRAELAAALAPVAGSRVTEATSVAEAVADLQATDQRIDLAVIDLEMSGSGAVTLTRKIREPQTLGPQNIAILLVGGAVGTSHYQAAARLGVQGHLARPFATDRLRAALRAAIIARPTGPMTRPAETAVHRDGKVEATAKPAVPVLYDQSSAGPYPNKPFRHGLQSLMRSTKPLTADDGFGFEAPPPAPRPQQTRTYAEHPAALAGLHFAVA
jgi:CheY-like chemotaxis protein